MAINVDQLIQRIETAINELEATREAQALIVANDALALIKRRIQLSGTDARGKKLGKYSRARVPFWFFANQPTLGNSSSRLAKLYKKYGYYVSYYEWRLINNLSNSDINLTFTGRMMAALRPFVFQRRGARILVTWRADHKEEQLKFEYNSERYPDAFALSSDEKSLVDDSNRERVRKILAKILQ